MRQLIRQRRVKARYISHAAAKHNCIRVKNIHHMRKAAPKA